MKLGMSKMLTDTKQLKRLIIVVSVLLVVSVLAFSAYYYYDRFYSSKPTAMTTTINKAEQDFAQDPNNLAKRLDLAQMYLVNKRYTDAINYSSPVLLAAPKNQRAWMLLGIS